MIELNHTIVPSKDKIAGAEFYARIFGFKLLGPAAHFIQLRISDALVFDFDNRDNFEPHHYAFKVDDDKFDEIFGRIQAEGIAYGSGPWALDDREINHRNGGRGVYFCDPDGHVLELLTKD